MASANKKWYSGPIAGGGGGLQWRGRDQDDDDAAAAAGETRDTASEYGAVYRPSEQLDDSLSMGKNSPKSHGEARSVHADDMDDADDGAVSEWNSDAGGSTTHKSHAYQASISSDEGRQPLAASKRTYKKPAQRKPAAGDLTEMRRLDRQGGFSSESWPQVEVSEPGSGGGISSSGNSFPSWSSNNRQQESDQSSVLHWTESESSTSGATRYPGPPGYRQRAQDASLFIDVDRMSIRMDEIREQKMKAQYQNMDGTRASVSSTSESSRSGGLDNRGRPAQSPHCCLHCRSDVCPAFMYLPLGSCCDNGRCRNCSHSCCIPSAASARRCHADPGHVDSGHRSRRGAQSYDAQTETPAGRDGNQTKKRSVWPVYGASSFMLCYECSALIQLPGDFNFLGPRRNKVRCGSCFRVVVFSLVHGNRIIPSHSTSVPSYGDSAAPADTFSSPSQSNRRSQDEDYGSTEYETDAGEGPRAGKKKRNPFALHKLMGYFSAKDVMQ